MMRRLEVPCFENVIRLLQLLDDVRGLGHVLDEGLALFFISANQSLSFQITKNLHDRLGSQVVLLGMFQEIGLGAALIRFLRICCRPHVDDPAENLLLLDAQIFIRKLSFAQLDLS